MGSKIAILAATPGSRYAPPARKTASTVADLGARIYQQIHEGQFRLLKVEGIQSDGHLSTTLHTQDLSHHLPYVAISYTWNEQDRLWYDNYDSKPKHIWISGILAAVPDKVANILCRALALGRSVVWIDTLCINQVDLVEKSTQVVQMGEVYQQATEVLAMIGSPSQITDMVLDAANNFAADKEIQLAPVTMSYLSKFINGPYWTRAWILQELTLAKSVLVCCGTKTAKLPSIAELGQAYDKRIQEGEGLTEIVAHRQYFWTALSGHVKYDRLYSAEDLGNLSKGPKESFLDLLSSSRHHAGCFDARDMLYARLALASDANKLIPYPDYTIEVEDLYKRFATNCIILTGSLKVITFANSSPMKLPSWVPDWSFKQRRWDLAEKFTELSKELAELSWSDKGLPRISRCRSELMVQGRILGGVSKRDWLETIASRTMALSKFSKAYDPSDIPRATDLFGILRSCPFPVHLRPVEDHFVLVGRHSLGRTYGAEVGLSTEEIEKPGNEATRTIYHLLSFDQTQALPEKIFKLR